MTQAAEDRTGPNAQSGETRARGAPRANAEGPPWEVDGEARNRLYRLAYRFLWNRDDAEDAVQSAVAQACERRAELRDPSKAWAWVCSIVVQGCRLIRRRDRRFRLHLAAYPRTTEPAGGASINEPSTWVRELLPRLPKRQYEVLVLRDLQGMSYDEIGQALGITASTARVHAQNGREALRKLIARERPELFLPGAERKP